MASQDTIRRSAPRILIVGAGIGGLTLAAALRQHGLTSTVVERAASVVSVGAGIGLGPNAMAILHRLGTGAPIAAAGRAVSELRITDEAGRLLQRLDLAHASRHFGGQTIALHRATLQDALLQPVRDLVRTNTTVTTVEPRGRSVAATLSDGSRDEYDLLVGADGIRSAVRRMVFDATAPRYAGYTSWRFVVPLPRPLPDSTEMWGRGCRLGLVPIGDGLLYGFAVLNRPAGAADAPEDRLARLKAAFGGFGGPAPDVLRLITVPEQLIHADIEEVTLRRWVRGPVALLGDAAHAMTPNLGQGAGMAIEDAFVLATLLANSRSTDQALARYQAQRMRRVREVQHAARRVGWMAQWSGRPAVALRSLLLRSLPDRLNERTIERLLAASPVKTASYVGSPSRPRR
jgi:2-polyprenyl-6-methoxyphenol hydroxylase-like FAD-dependent oxidoreductase